MNTIRTSRIKQDQHMKLLLISQLFITVKWIVKRVQVVWHSITIRWQGLVNCSVRFLVQEQQIQFIQLVWNCLANPQVWNNFWGQFHQHFMSSFHAFRSQKHKKTLMTSLSFLCFWFESRTLTVSCLLVRWMLSRLLISNRINCWKYYQCDSCTLLSNELPN